MWLINKLFKYLNIMDQNDTLSRFCLILCKNVKNGLKISARAILALANFVRINTKLVFEVRGQNLPVVSGAVLKTSPAAKSPRNPKFSSLS